jgi:hypothetical protein
MIYKKLSLCLAAVLIILVIYYIPFYNNWVSKKFDSEISRITDGVQHLEPEARKQFRFGRTYIVINAMKTVLDRSKAQDVVVLLPPKKFLDAVKVNEGSFEVPEPAVFYYFTGYKAVDKNSAAAESANWALRVINHKLALQPLASRRACDTLLAAYKLFN